MAFHCGIPNNSLQWEVQGDSTGDVDFKISASMEMLLTDWLFLLELKASTLILPHV